MRTRIGRPTWATLAALLALVLSASSCRVDSDNATPSREAPSPLSNDINPVPRAQLPDGGTLRWPVRSVPANFNIHAFDGPGISNGAVIGALMPSVFAFDAAGRPILRSEYVELAELSATAPEQIVTYRINPRATWSDGTPITVADFEAQWRALNGTDPAYRVATTQGYDKIERVAQGRDDREVVVTFAEPYVDWRALFNPLYPASTTADPRVFNDGWRDRPLLTAGPFTFESIDQTAKSIILVRNARWWGEPAKLERIVYRAMDSDAQIDALANDEIDFANIGSNVDNLRRAEATPGISVREASAPNYVHITMNGASEVLQDVRVRRALAMGIDRGAIAQALLGPLGVPLTPLGNHILMADQAGYQDNSGDIGSYLPERARALLDEAGWRLDGTNRAKDGRDLVLRYVIRAQVAEDRQVAELVRGMLDDLGVEVQIEAVPFERFFEGYIEQGNFDLTTFEWYGSVFPLSAAKAIYGDVTPGSPLGVRLNYARIGSPEIDQLFDRATAEFDPTTAIEIANDIDEMIWLQVHSLPLYQRPAIVATKSHLANFGAFGSATIAYEDIGFTERS